MDRFQLFDGFEDPKQWEGTIHLAFRDAEQDEALAKVLRYAFLEKDIGASFRRYQKSAAPQAISALLQRLGLSLESLVADVGCGRGHLAFALHKLGYSSVTAMDPNGEWFTGTGYLKSRTDHNIRMVNDLSEWRKIDGQYDAIVSSGTVHHWQHIPRVAIDTRRVMKPGAYWLMISEWFASSPRELLACLSNHPTANRYHSYEWAYPASAYVDLVQTSGFNLVGVIPQTYCGNKFLGYSVPNDPKLSRWVDENLTAPNGTVEAFWSEVDAFRRTRSGVHIYTAPQVPIFQRIEI